MKVLAGDWPERSDVRLVSKKLLIQSGNFKSETIPTSDIEGFEIVTENNRASALGKLGWGAAGAVALGPLGLLVGVVAGGNKRDRIMAVTIRGGRRMLLQGNIRDAEAMTKATFSTQVERF